MNVLLVGDLRSVKGNYGAMATTESLISRIKEYNVELKCIDWRSICQETPMEGWPLSVEEYLSAEHKTNRSILSTVKGCVKQVLPYVLGKSIQDKQERNETYTPFVPYRFRDYPAFAEKVICGERMKFENRMLDWADIVIFNSEGSIVRGTDKFGYYRIGGLYMLFMEYLSKVAKKKPTYIINHTIDPGNRDAIEIIKNTYPVMDGVLIRERKSLRLVESWGIHNARLVPDALFLYNDDINKKEGQPKEYTEHRDYSKKLICMGDSSGMFNAFGRVKWNVGDFYDQLIGKLEKLGYQVVFIDGGNGADADINRAVNKHGLIHLMMSNCNYKQLYNVLRDAEIFISGRWHASILSIQAGTPILLWGADSHKTEALYDLINYPYRFYDVASLPIHIDDIVEDAMKIMQSDNSRVFEIVAELKKAAAENTYMLESYKE